MWLDRVYAGKALKTLVKKVVVDQLVASPTLGVWYFLGEKDFTGTKYALLLLLLTHCSGCEHLNSLSVTRTHAHFRDQVQRQRLRIKMWIRKNPAYVIRRIWSSKGICFEEAQV